MSEALYRIVYGRSMEKDMVLESREMAEMQYYMGTDESQIYQCLHWNTISQDRIRDIWNWQRIIRCFKVSFQPESDFEIRTSQNLNEIPFACSCCFLSDFDNLNPIVYCDQCDTGCHQKCYGIDQELLE